MKVKKTITATINKCYEECPYFGLDGNQMECEHPLAKEDPYIITHPECDNGFPEECPLIKEAIKPSKNTKIKSKIVAEWVGKYVSGNRKRSKK